MSGTEHLEILLVRNADSPAARDASQRAHAVLAAGGYHGVFVDAPSASELTHKLTEILLSRVLHVVAVVAVGGDGMAHGVLQVVHRARQQGVSVAFGLIPAGSGNDLARFCGVPTRDVEGAADQVLRGLEIPARYMDLLRVRCADGSEHVCATTVCLGIDARVNALANRWTRVRASAKYAVALLAEISRMRARRYSLQFEYPHGARQTVERTLTFLSVANTSSYGGGLTLAPSADHRDGRAEFFAVADVTRPRLLTLLPHLLLRTHERLEQVTLEHILAVRVTPQGPEPVDVAHGDGEALGPLPAEVRVLPEAVPVLF